MSSKAARPLLRSKVQKSNDTKAQDGTIKYHDEIVFESNATDQRVTVFDSKSVLEPFMDTKVLEELRRKHRNEPRSKT